MNHKKDIISEKFNQFVLTINSIREATKIFYPSYHCRTILNNLDIIEEVYYKELMSENYENVINLLEREIKEENYLDSFGIIERDNRLILYLIDKIKKELQKVKKIKENEKNDE